MKKTTLLAVVITLAIGSILLSQYILHPMPANTDDKKIWITETLFAGGGLAFIGLFLLFTNINKKVAA